jgi:hypothetical protein
MIAFLMLPSFLCKRSSKTVEQGMTDDDTMDVLIGFAILLALALFAAAWFHTFSEWESTWQALVAPFAVKVPAPAPSPTIIV